MTPNAEHSLAPWYDKIGGGIAEFMMRLVDVSQHA